MRIRVKLRRKVRVKVMDERAHLYSRWTCLVGKLAMKMSQRWNRDFIELYEEGLSHLAFTVCEKWHEYNPEKSQEQTWIYQCIYWHLWIYCENAAKRSGVALQDGDPYPERRSFLARLFCEVGEEARVLLVALFEAPGELAETVSPRAPVRTKLVVSDHLREKGWSDLQIQRAWNEVEQVVMA